MKIDDGTGTSSQAKVDSTNKLEVRSVSTEDIVNANINGNAFISTSGPQTLTTDTTSSILYMKNNSNKDIIFDLLSTIVGPSTGGVGMPLSVNTINPTGGTLITDETTGFSANLNVGSSALANVTVYTGSEGKTVTGGPFLTALHPNGPIRQDADYVAIISKGQSLSWGFQPPTGNTSMQVQVFVRYYFLD